MPYTSFRPAVAMIELIFALVIMAITLMSAPMLISVAKQSTSVAVQQESINEAVSRINMILTYAWDQNDTNTSCIPPVLRVSSGDIELNENGTSGRRSGVPLLSNSHTYLCGSTRLNASTNLTMEGTIKNDIDDFTNTVVHLTNISTGSGGKDYIDHSIDINTTIKYLSDTAVYSNSTITYIPISGTATSNIKQINVTLISTSGVSELKKTITLNAFSCNIGGYEYKWRQF